MSEPRKLHGSVLAFASPNGKGLPKDRAREGKSMQCITIPDPIDKDMMNVL